MFIHQSKVVTPVEIVHKTVAREEMHMPRTPAAKSKVAILTGQADQLLAQIQNIKSCNW